MKLLYTSILVCFSIFTLLAQVDNVPRLERKISLTAQNKTIEVVLTEVGRLADVSFSYNPDAIKAARHINIDADNQTMRTVLNRLFQGEVSYRSRGKFVILQPVKQNSKSQSAVVEGYLYNPGGEILADASVYSSSLQEVVNTDQFGYFKIRLDEKDTANTLHVSKSGYEGAMLMATPGRSTFVQIELGKPDSIRLVAEDQLNPLRMVKRELQVTTDNIPGTVNRFLQVSFLPHLGTNGLLTGSTINQVSLNLIGGYVHSVGFLELGGYINIVRKDVRGLQGSGFANYVGRNVRGVQGSGFFNFVGERINGLQGSGFGNFAGKEITGLQAAGFVNYAGSDLSGVQGSGFYGHIRGNLLGVQGAGFATNVGGRASGVQGAGFFNRTGGGFSGVQGAGFFNLAGKESVGLQGAGFINIAHQLSGLQASGAVNLASKIQGAQMTGFFNSADTVNGIQASGFINRAGLIKGVQLGIINIADSCAGAPIGIFNFVRKGYHQLCLYTTETFRTNIAYRGGTQKLYTTIMAGANSSAFPDTSLFTFGLGMGSTLVSGRKINFDVDVLAQQVGLGDFFGDINMIYSVGLSIDWKFSRKAALFAGITYNNYLVDSSTAQYRDVFSKMVRTIQFEQSPGTNLNLKTWIGFKAGIRLF
jgi:hypothetical protein